MKARKYLWLSLCACASTAVYAQQPVIGLITKTETNPFFVKMKEGAAEAAKANGAKLMTAAGKFDGDNASQVTAIENMVTAGAKAILITPSDTKAIVPAIKKARDAGVLVIALDTPTDPQEATDALFATDNFKAGVLIGQYAKAAMAGKPAKIATLDLAPGITVGQLRHDGFLQGFGQWIKEATRASSAARIRRAIRPRARRRWRTACRRRPDINVVYTINEPAAAGAYQALKAAGKEKGVLIVSVDGGCAGVKERQGRHHRRDLAAVSVEDGAHGRRRGRGVRQDRQEGIRLHRHRRDAHHRQADEGRRQQGHQVRHGRLLGQHSRSRTRARLGPRPGPRGPERFGEEVAQCPLRPSQRAVSGWHGVLEHLPPLSTLGPFIALLLACIFFASQSDRFLTGQNFSLILQQVMVVGVLAIGQTLVILTAGIDLSCGMVMALGSIVMTKFAVDLGMNPYLAILCGLLVTAAFGLLNGALITSVRLPPFIVTLGTLNIAFAITQIYSQSQTVVGLPDPLLFLGNTFKIGDTAVTYGTVLMLVMYLVAWIVLRETAAGRHLYAVGNNPEAARLMGISTRACCSPSTRWRACSTASPRCCWWRAPASAIRRPGRPTTWTASPPWCSAAPACSAGAASSWAP